MLTFASRNVINKLQVYKTLVSPHLVYRMQLCLPHYKEDVTVLEGTKMRLTRVVPGLELSERLVQLGLFTVEWKRPRGDLIEVYKIMRRINRVHNKNFLEYMEFQPCCPRRWWKQVSPQYFG